MKTKTISFILSIVMLFGITSGIHSTALAATSGDYEYKLLENGTVEITQYTDSAAELTIPSEIDGYAVTSIGEWAFHSCEGLTSITIPNSVTSIGDSAFAWCTNLASITIPDSVTSIGFEAFYGCAGLTSIAIPNSVTSIGDWAFGCCTDLASIIVDENNQAYDSRNNCNAIIETASNTLIFGCKNTTIPDNVTSIEEYAFGECTGLTSITIPGSVTSIAEYAFYDCTGLTSVTIPNDSTEIGDWAIPDQATIYGYLNSTAQAYAEKNGNKFIDIITTITPSAPTATYAVNSDCTFTISWNAVLGADKYEIYSSNDGGKTYKYARTTTETSINTGTAAYGVTYKYKIRAVNSTNNEKSEYCTVDAVNNKSLVAPTAKYAVNSDRTLTVSWNKITGADTYEVYYSSDGGSTYKLKTITTETSVKSGQVAYGIGFRYKVRAVNNSKNLKSAYSNVVNAVNNKYLAEPTAKYTLNADCTFTISWNKITGADKYEIYFSNDGGKTYKYARTTAETSIKTGTAAYGVNYKYKIRAVNSEHNLKSAYSNVVNAVNNKKLVAPTAKLNVNTDGTFTISWNKITGAEKYEIYMYDSAKDQYKLSRTLTGTSVTTTKAAKDKTYCYKVRAITSENASATSDFSKVVTGKR